MNIQKKCLENGFCMPEYGLGTWQMGGRSERDFSNDDSADIEAIRNAIRAGVTHIDTAEKYANGHTEVLIGEALKDFERGTLFLASKVRSEHFKADSTVAACMESLKRLQTNYLDLYLLHTYSEDVPLKETISGLHTLVESGHVKNIGVCNFSVEHLKEAQSYARYPIVCNQVHYNLIFRESEHAGLLDYCQSNDVLLSAWRPVQKGELANSENALMMHLCAKYSATPSQIAIAWVTAQKNVVTISKTRSAVHLAENLGALQIKITDEDIELLRMHYPEQRIISDAVPLR
jgi:diketogulonate reductase-like aldo/keto reductase